MTKSKISESDDKKIEVEGLTKPKTSSIGKSKMESFKEITRINSFFYGGIALVFAGLNIAASIFDD